MTILEIKKILVKNSNKRFKEIFVARCDECQKEFIINCGKKSFLKKEFHFCCRDCLIQSQKTGVIQEKTKQTCLKNYGVEYPLQSKKIQEKTKQTCLEKYGVEHPKQSKEIKEKTKQTCLDRYGVTCPLKSEKVKEKIKQTCLEQFGCEHPAQSKEIQDKRKQTCLEKYGCEHPLQNREISIKMSKSRNNSSIIKHWKTNEDLVCTASYEIAFVNWCNKNEIDFDWQILFETSILTKNGNKSIYIIDAFIKSGEFANTYIEIKGYFKDENSHMKWDLFHKTHINSQLWDYYRLKELGII